MRRTVLAISSLPLALASVMAAPATYAAADPGHCWVQGGVADAAPATAYQIKNKCNSSIRGHLPQLLGRKLLTARRTSDFDN